MSIVLMLVFQFASPVLIALVLIRYLRRVMLRMLTDLCGTEERAEFWVKACAVLMVLAPLVIVLMAAHNPVQCVPDNTSCFELVLRQTIVLALIGALATIGTFVYVVANYIPRGPTVVPAPKVEA
jgi:uncharacterized membrane protein YhaH (DUF805 family)